MTSSLPLSGITPINRAGHLSVEPSSRRATLSEIPEAAQNFHRQGRREFGRRGVLVLYVEVDGRLRTKLEGIFSSRLREAERAHKTFDRRGVVAGQTQLFIQLAMLHIYRQHGDLPT